MLIFQSILSIFTNMEKKNYRLIGVMSGTSLDGIDLVFTEIDFNGIPEFKIVFSETVSYSEEWKEKLQKSLQLDPEKLHQLDEEYTAYLSKEISKFIENNEIDLLDAVCSHGHTVKHLPANGITLQIGNLPRIADLTGVPVVCDFRVQDVELGGQGAPLVPIGDRLLFGHYEYCMNLGGFANISTEKDGQRFAFDICPVNTVMNAYSKKLGLDFDNEGKLAEQGNVCAELLEKLNDLKFYKLPAPKSLGIEWVNAEIFPLIDSFNLGIQDILRTFVEHVAVQITRVIKNDAEVEILVTGGGAYNAFLMNRLSELSKAKFTIPENDVVEYKEALIFALLGALKLRGEINVLSSVTGAKMDHSSGRVYEPRNI